MWKCRLTSLLNESNTEEFRVEFFLVYKPTRKRNAKNLFPRHFSHVVLNGFIFIYRYAGLYTFHALSIFLQSLLYFRSIYHRCKNTRATRAVLPRGVSIQKSVYTCAWSIYLTINDNNTQSGLTAKAKFRTKKSQGIFEYVLLQIVVAHITVECSLDEINFDLPPKITTILLIFLHDRYSWNRGSSGI